MNGSFIGKYPVNSGERYTVLAVVELVTVNGNPPTVVRDPSGVLAASDPVTRPGEGILDLNLRHNWGAISAFPVLVDGDVDESVQVESIDTTLGSMHVGIRTSQETGAGVREADDIPGTTVHVLLVLQGTRD